MAPLMLRPSALRVFSSRHQPLDRRRTISSYGYTQASALIYSQHGEPKDVLTLHKHSLAPPHSSLLNLATLASPINPADINLIQGVYPPPTKPLFTPHLLGSPTPSAVPGNEAVFSVLSTGSAVTNFQPGDWAIPTLPGFGCWRTNVQCSEDTATKGLMRITEAERDGLTPTQVAGVGVNPCTAYRMLSDYGHLPRHSGNWFVQNGANSGVGRMAIQIGKLWGLRSINVIRDRDEGVEALKEELRGLGADVVVTDKELQSRGFADRVREEHLDGGRWGISLALNCVGGPPAMAMAKLLQEGGEVVTYGAMGRQLLTVPASLMIFRDVRFRGFWVSRWGRENEEGRREMVREILGWMREGRVRESGGREVRWGEEAKVEDLRAEVQKGLEGGRGKGVLVFDQE